MSNLRFSNTDINTLVMADSRTTYGQLINTWTSNSYPINTTVAGGYAGQHLLLVFGGVVPTFSAVTDRATHAADLLISFTLGTGVSNYTSLGYINGSRRYLVGQCSTPTAATASGTASWFMLCRAGTTTLTDKAAIMGTISGPGGGGDMEISNASVVSGTTYTSAGFYLNFPDTWTF